MVAYAGPRIVKVVRVDDGSTTGEKVLVDENGNTWKGTFGSYDSGGTADTIGTLRGNRIFVES